MSELEELERKIESLSPGELAKFREWFFEFDWKAWDAQLERDAKSGKLDRVMAEAMEDHRAGRAREL